MAKGNSIYRCWGKRVFDLALAVPAMILLAPLMGIIGVIVLLRLGKPVIYKQMRPGIHNNLFPFYKFRTMTNACDDKGNLLPDEKRLTRIGEFLRKTSLDELPELWNVLKGDMSLVGPRPLLVKYLDRYTLAQARRHELKPGITGWAQVNGRNAITWDQKFEYDVWYVDNLSLWLDIKIIFMTIIKVIKGEGINQPGQATMEEFMGSQKN